MRERGETVSVCVRTCVCVCIPKATSHRPWLWNINIISNSSLAAKSLMHYTMYVRVCFLCVCVRQVLHQWANEALPSHSPLSLLTCSLFPLSLSLHLIFPHKLPLYPEFSRSLFFWNHNIFCQLLFNALMLCLSVSTLLSLSTHFLCQTPLFSSVTYQMTSPPSVFFFFTLLSAFFCLTLSVPLFFLSPFIYY